MTCTLYTLGHGDRDIDDLRAVLAAHGIAVVVDVRAQPASQRHPQFNGAELRAALEAEGLEYHWAGRALGGRRAARADSRHRALPEPAFRGYADHMETEVFIRGARQLLQLAARAPSAMLCAERAPGQCHRSLIADYLLLQGAQVLHLVDAGAARAHLLHPAARRESAALIYDRHTTGALDLG